MSYTNKKPDLRVVGPTPCQSWHNAAAAVPAKNDIERMFRLQALAKMPTP